MGTVQPLEVIWLLIALVGCGFSVYNLLDSLKDLRAVDLLTNGNRDVAIEVAGLSLRNEVARLILFCYLVMIGLVAVLIPPPTQPIEHPTANALISVLFVLMAVTLVVKTTMTFFARRKIMRLLQRQEIELPST